MIRWCPLNWTPFNFYVSMMLGLWGTYSAIVTGKGYPARWTDTSISTQHNPKYNTREVQYMGVLSSTEKLKILAFGKATLKEINELEELAANEPESIPTPEPTPEPNTEPTPEPNVEPESNTEPDEKDKRIAELEKQLEEARTNNIHANNDGIQPSFDEQLDNMFKGYRF